MTNTEIARAIVEGKAEVFVTQQDREPQIALRGLVEHIPLRKFLFDLLAERSVKAQDIDRVKYYATHGLASMGQQFGEKEQVKAFGAIEAIEKLAE